MQQITPLPAPTFRHAPAPIRTPDGAMGLKPQQRVVDVGLGGFEQSGKHCRIDIGPGRQVSAGDSGQNRGDQIVRATLPVRSARAFAWAHQ
jgi:hypothetical protein